MFVRKYIPSVLIIFVIIKTHSQSTGLNNNHSKIDIERDQILSRKQRYIAFPVGSTFSIATCMTVGVIGNPNVNYLSLGLNWGISYNLPNITWILERANGHSTKSAKPPPPPLEPVVKRRDRRDLYQKLEILMDGFYIISLLLSLMGKLQLIDALKSLQSFDNYGDSKLLSTMQESNLMTGNLNTPHRRSKRYIAFPEGSSFTCAVCFTVGVVGSPSFNYLSYGLNWGIAYDLPNETWIIDHLHGFSSTREPSLAVLKRRNRRSMYHSIENLIDRMGYNGRDCILRALCESRQFFHSKKMGMIPELIRTIFSLPKTKLFSREIEEHSDIKHYNSAYFSDDDEDCELRYSCSFSLIELAMGRYSEPSDDYYG